MKRMIISVCLVVISCYARCQTHVDVRVGSLDCEVGLLKGCCCDVYASKSDNVGPVWLPSSGSVVVGRAQPSIDFLGANIQMSLLSVAVKNENLVHRIKVDSKGVLAPKKSLNGGVKGNVLGGVNHKF